MLDNTKARNVLKAYIDKYDFSNPRIKLKAEHIFRVADAAKKIILLKNFAMMKNIMI